MLKDKHSKANNKYIEKYGSSEESVYIIYLDANNLYGWAVIQYLPYGEFKWLSKTEIDKTDLNSTGEKSSIGYILEAELENPSELHELHNYPFAPEKLEMSQDMFSKYCFENADEYGIKFGGVNKLIPNLKNKRKYVVHYSNVQLYLSLEMRMTRIHRVLRFQQSN